jgi:hypothetical protein
MGTQVFNIKRFCTGLLILGLTVGCSEDSDSTKKPAPKQQEYDWFSLSEPVEKKLQITDETGAPIAGAKVLIGNGVDSPFRGNFLVADPQGQVQIPLAWAQEEMVTVAAPGFVRATFLSLAPVGKQLILRKAFGVPQVEVAGLGTGFKVKDFDKISDFGVMMSALRKHDFFTFDLGMVISPQMDKIEAVGQKMNVPSNVSIPRQKESYSIVTVTLDKPKYRIYFHEYGPKTVYAIRGQFPFKKVVDELRDGKMFLDLINHFDIQGGAIRELAVNAPKTDLDIPVNELNFAQKLGAKAPSFASDETLLMLAASEYKGLYLPTDVKKVDAGKVKNLNVAAGSTPYLIRVLKPKNETTLGAGRLSAAIEPFFEGTQPELLPLMPSPQVAGLHKVSFQPPASRQDVQELATFSMLSTVVKTKEGEVERETVTRVWDVYGQGWISGFTLPKMPGDTEIQGNKRWEVSVVGSQTSGLVDLGPKVFETATHASLTFTDF